MLNACAVKFDVTRNLENFRFLVESKQGLNVAQATCQLAPVDGEQFVSGVDLRNLGAVYFPSKTLNFSRFLVTSNF